MKKKINPGRKLSLNKEKLNQLNEAQLTHFLGGRMAASTGYTAIGVTCSSALTECCSTWNTMCCWSNLCSLKIEVNMKRKINHGKKLTLNKEKLNQLNEKQLTHFLGGRMASSTTYTGPIGCSIQLSDCCSLTDTACCWLNLCFFEILISMKKKINLGKKLSLNKEKLNQLNEEQLSHFMGGRLLVASGYTSGDGGTCSEVVSSCCSTTQSACCG